MDGVSLTAARWLAASLPVLALLFLLIFTKTKAPAASAISWFTALLIAWWGFGITGNGFWIATGKGLSLALFVLLIIWSAVLLYNLVKHTGAVDVIGGKLSTMTGKGTTQLLLMSWCFASFIQGIAGFGVPVVIVAPLLVGMGFSPVVAATAVLVGHAWSVTFGSMASSYYSLQLVVDFDPTILVGWLAFLFVPAIFVCGLSVSHMYGGWKEVRKSLLLVCSTSIVMGLVLNITVRFGVIQLGTLLAGACGMTFLILVSKSAKTNVPEKMQTLSFGWAAFPYTFLIVVVGMFQINGLKETLNHIQSAFSFPATVTTMGHSVSAVTNYASIRLFSHPAPFLLLSFVISFGIFKRMGRVKENAIREIVQKTAKQCWPTTVSIGFLVVMALVMNDSGMTSLLAHGVAQFSGRIYPLLSPFVGVLGSFMTGSNTNSNILFGDFQKQIAVHLQMNVPVIVAAQSVGASLGSAMAPAKVLLGATSAGLVGEEGKVLKLTIMYCLVNVFIIGVLTLFLS